MLIRKRVYAELAGTILLWGEEMPDNPPFTWNGYAMRRPVMIGQETVQFRDECFKGKSEESVVEYLKLTLQNDAQFREYAHRLRELRWKECEASDDDWEKRVQGFIAEGQIE